MRVEKSPKLPLRNLRTAPKCGLDTDENNRGMVYIHGFIQLLPPSDIKW